MSVTAISPVSFVTSGSTSALAAATDQSSLTTSEQATPLKSSSATQSSAITRLLNPDPTIDPALGIVVTSYYAQDGALSYQYPIKTALAHYAVYGLPGQPGDTGTSSA